MMAKNALKYILKISYERPLLSKKCSGGGAFIFNPLKNPNLSLKPAIFDFLIFDFFGHLGAVNKL